jgi:hypothetical protein
VYILKFGVEGSLSALAMVAVWNELSSRGGGVAVPHATRHGRREIATPEPKSCFCWMGEHDFKHCYDIIFL